MKHGTPPAKLPPGVYRKAISALYEHAAAGKFEELRMSEKVLNIAGKRAVHSGLVALLEAVLEKAKRGEVVEGMVMMQTTEGNWESGSSANMDRLALMGEMVCMLVRMADRQRVD